MWAYRGRPLYRYVKDQQPGSVAGEGIADDWGVWHAARLY
jgi:predicted lipoprotein with Yx(FWY)xxD motif